MRIDDVTIGDWVIINGAEYCAIAKDTMFCVLINIHTGKTAFFNMRDYGKEDNINFLSHLHHDNLKVEKHHLNFSEIDIGDWFGVQHPTDSTRVTSVWVKCSVSEALCIQDFTMPNNNAQLKSFDSIFNVSVSNKYFLDFYEYCI